MKKSILLAAASVIAMNASGALADTELNALFMSQAAYSEQNIKDMTAEFEAANPGVTVNMEFVPYEALHDKIVASVGAGDNGYDVVLFDVIWPAEFAVRGFLSDLSARIPSELDDQIFDGAWTTVEYKGAKFGMPWILDTKYMFYNTEILEKAGIEKPPATWDELLVQAQIIKDKGLVEYPLVWSWSQSEAMICDYTTILSAFGGKFFNDNDPKSPAFNSGGSLRAVEYMAGSLKDGLTNPASTEYFEEDVRRVFSNGDAAFALNWTYMNSLVNDPNESSVAGKVGVVPGLGVEGVSTASAVNGSMGLGIPVNSPHSNEAWSYIAHLTNMSVQEKYASLSLPVWKASYTESAVVDGQEDLVAAATDAIAVMYPRPLVKSYTEISGILQSQIHGALLGQTDAKVAMDEAAARVKAVR
ncbi:extracellular solute-binding protein [Maritalea sp.]|uniref:extracellular solute-binding protein n=1 Tax=Maritalea sp. TaxID=2003361 RepID=UPI003EF5A5B6